MPQVFISYSHDSQEHKDRVLRLADRLCHDGIDCTIDQYKPSPPQGWPRWMLDQVEEADFLLIVCTETYRQRFRGKTPEGSGKGVKWEGAIITQELYDAEMMNRRFIPVVMSSDDIAHRPVVLRGATFYNCGTDSGYVQLLRHLTDQPLTPKPKLGKTPVLEPKSGRGGGSLQQSSAQLHTARDRLKQLIKTAASQAEIDAAKADVLAAKRAIREGNRLRPGDVLVDRYELLECVGSGGFATVWKCFDDQTMTVVAAKILHHSHREERSKVERFFRGSRLMKQLAHENIVRVLDDKCSDEHFHFYIMDFVDGGDFREAVLAKRLTQEDVLDIILAAGDALHYAHSTLPEMVHRDIKPSNILLTNENRARITDFDLVRMADTTGGTRTGSLGTWIYAAPESMAKASQADVRADVFSLGMTAVFGLYGDDLPMDVLRSTSEFILSLDCHDELKRVLERAVNWELSERFSSMRAFTDAVREALTQSSASSQDATTGTAVESGRPATTKRKATKKKPAAGRTRTDTPRRRVEKTSDDDAIRNSLGMTLRLISAGQFMMGERDSKHQVEITTPFYLGVYPVTQGEYERLTGQNPSNFKGDEQRPVEYVSWSHAVAFCNRLSEQEELTPYYEIDGDDVAIRGGEGYRLPTEAEWEYACRAGTTTQWSCGDEEADLKRVAWYRENSESKTHAVGQKEPNAWQLYDMHGNVWEWCWDWYGKYDTSSVVDPAGPATGSRRVLRGGSWVNPADDCRCSSRDGSNPNNRLSNVGFRLARTYS